MQRSCQGPGGRWAGKVLQNAPMGQAGSALVVQRAPCAPPIRDLAGRLECVPADPTFAQPVRLERQRWLHLEPVTMEFKRSVLGASAPRAKVLDSGRGAAEARLVQRWERSLRLGADPSGARWAEDGVVGSEELRSVHDALEPLRRSAETLLGEFARYCDAADHVAILTDAQGVIAQVSGGGSFRQSASDLRLIEGAVWSEDLRGTNAIGTALAEGQAVRVDGAAHFAQVNEGLSCMAAPLRDPFGQVVGVLDATSVASGTGTLKEATLLDVARALEELLRVHAYAGSAAGTSGLRLVERLMDRAGGPAFLVERPGRVVRRNGAATQLQQLPGEDPALPSFDELLAIAGGAANASYAPALGLGQHGATSYRVEAEAIQNPAGDVLGLVVFLDVEARRKARVSAQVRGTDPFASIIGDDADFEAAIKTARQLAPSRLPILLLAETGTGKDLFARALHDTSERSKGRFVALNCGALHPDLLLSELFGHGPAAFTGASRSGQNGAVQAASGGTLFLDEVADLSPEAQVALLRVLETGTFHRVGESVERTVDLRVVAATSRDLHGLVTSGGFREDLFYRIGGATITLPPLRTRTDVALLVEHLWDGLQAERGSAAELDPSALACLVRHPWPGNVRELRSALEYASVMSAGGSPVLPSSLPKPIGGLAVPDAPTFAAPVPISLPAPGNLAAKRQQAIEQALRDSGGNVSEAARRLGVARSTIYRLVKRWERGS